MATLIEDSPVNYEDLAQIEQEFEDVETEIIRQQVKLSKPLYERRQKLVAQIPNFWPLVLEQAPPEIDQFIQPSDSEILMSALESLSVSHFEIEDGDNAEGDPRSIAIRFEFKENDNFEDRVLEKKFWYRRAKDGWSGLVSEPVNIKWKKGKDLTEGLLDQVCKTWAASQQQQNNKSDSSKKREMTADETKLLEKIESTGMGGLSFFAWFGFIGRRISAEESKAAKAVEAERQSLKKQGKEVPEEEDEEDEDFDLSEEIDANLEIFPDGDDLAVAIDEDLWPGALRLFSQAQEQDELSDADFESGDEEDLAALEELGASSDGSDAGDEPPVKKRKT